MTGRRGIIAASEGTTTVEFAFAAVSLIMLVFGAIEMGRMIWTQQVLQAAASETARCLAIGSGNCPNAADFAVTAASIRGLTGLDATDVAASATDSCGSSTGNFAKVSITYAYTAILPAYIPVPSGGLTASACFPH